jgi:hypothetical protein
MQPLDILLLTFRQQLGRLLLKPFLKHTLPHCAVGRKDTSCCPESLSSWAMSPKALQFYGGLCALAAQEVPELARPWRPSFWGPKPQPP